MGVSGNYRQLEEEAMERGSATRMTIATVCLIGLAGVAACGSAGLVTGAGSVDKKTAEVFLKSAEAEWRSEAGSGPTQNLPGEARCYFVTGDENRSLGTMACGPVRRLGTSEAAVWDVARIEGTNAGDETGLRIVDGDAWQRSVARPAEGKLTRPDNQEPTPGVDQLALPPAPPAQARLVQVVNQLGDTGATKLAEHNEPLISPDVTVTVTGLGEIDTIGSGSQIKGPAAGEKFIAARFSTVPTNDPLIGGVHPEVDTTFAVTVDGDARPVDLVPADSHSKPGGGYLIASVPTAANEVLLTATTSGVTQSLSLLTGKRTSTNVAGAYYRPNRTLVPNKRLPAKTVKFGRDFNTTYTIALTRVGLTAWDPDKGWAPTGQAWLRFTYADTWRRPSALYEITWNPRFFTATADGRPINLPTDYSDYTKTLTAPVPAGVKTIRITVTASLTFAEHPGSNYAQPKSGSANFGTLTADAVFG